MPRAKNRKLLAQNIPAATNSAAPFGSTVSRRALLSLFNWGGKKAYDRVLATEEELVPSHGFLAVAMERVREQAATPPPIPFPWKRALLGILPLVGAIGWAVYEAIASVPSQAREFVLRMPSLSAADLRSVEDAGWVAIALTASFCSWLVSRQLAGRSGLL